MNNIELAPISLKVSTPIELLNIDCPIIKKFVHNWLEGTLTLEQALISTVVCLHKQNINLAGLVNGYHTVMQSPKIYNEDEETTKNDNTRQST